MTSSTLRTVHYVAARRRRSICNDPGLNTSPAQRVQDWAAVTCGHCLRHAPSDLAAASLEQQVSDYDQRKLCGGRLLSLIKRYTLCSPTPYVPPRRMHQFWKGGDPVDAGAPEVSHSCTTFWAAAAVCIAYRREQHARPVRSRTVCAGTQATSTGGHR